MDNDKIQTTPNGDIPQTPADDTKKSDEVNKDAMVPSFRLREETEKRQKVEKDLADMQAKWSEVEKAKSDEEEQKQIKAWEFEKAMAKVKEENKGYKEALDSYKAKDEFLSTLAKQKLDEFKSMWDDVYNSIVWLIWSEDPMVILSKIDSVSKLVWQQKKAPTGGTDVGKTVGTRKEK